MAHASWNDLPESKVTWENHYKGAPSPDGTQELSGSLYDLKRANRREEGMYEFIVWDVKAGKRLATFFRGWEVDYSTGTVDGLPVKSFWFSEDGASIVISDQDDNEQTVAIQLKPGSP